MKIKEPIESLFRIKRGLCGYISYLAACEMNNSFSEYVLYEPILRILNSRGYIVECEAICPNIAQPSRGDKKKIDFVAQKEEIRFALEVKWAKISRIDIKSDLEKLHAFKDNCSVDRSFLCVFGRQSIIGNLDFSGQRLFQQGKIITADFGITKYSCRAWEYK